MCVCIHAHVQTHTDWACLCDSVEFMSEIRDGRVNSSVDSLLIECSLASAAFCLPNEQVCVSVCVCSFVCVRERENLLCG